MLYLKNLLLFFINFIFLSLILAHFMSYYGLYINVETFRIKISNGFPIN